MINYNSLQSTTKEKILDIVYHKIRDGFDADFLPLNKFEEILSQEKISIIKRLKSLKEKYDTLLNSKETRSELLNTTKEEFVLEKFNDGSRWNTYRITDLKDLKKSENEKYKSFEKTFDYNFSKKQFIFISPTEYIYSQIENKNFNKNENSIQDLFWKFCRYMNYCYFQNFDFSVEGVYEKLIEKFHENYTSNKYLRLFDITEKNLVDLEFSGFEPFIINVGNRRAGSIRSGWITSSFEVINNKKTYEFSTSSKDEKAIDGSFVNIFILQFQKKRLLKLSISLSETELTPYIVYKDFEKVSLKNDCEILITKHHGNEYLIFDSKKQALDFQEKVMELKAGNNRFQR